MQDSSTHDATRTPRVRVALVQFDYQPSAVLAYPLMEEPVLLAEGEQGITSLHFSIPQVEQQISTLRHDIANEYERFIRQRLCHILKRLNGMSVDIVVFPEYSIPASCLASIEEFAEDYIVVAASHTVTPVTLEICQNLNIEMGSRDIGKSICPIRMKNGVWKRVDKLTRSRFEETLKHGTVWEPIRMQDRGGKNCSFAVLLCVDFINENDPNYQKIVPRDLWSKVQFGVVPSFSPAMRDFEQHARYMTERAGRPIIYVNAASEGGSRVHCHFREASAFNEMHGTKTLAHGDEAVVIVDLPLGSGQFDSKPTPLPVLPTSELVSLLPILPKERFARYCTLNDKVRATINNDQKRTILQEARPELLDLASQSDVPSVLKTKVFTLIEAIDWRDAQWLNDCIDCIPLSSKEGSLDEVRFILLRRAQELLLNIMRNPLFKGSELEKVHEVLGVYRRAQDSLRPSIPKQLFQEFNATDQSIHTLSDDNSTSPTFTSAFLMRLRSARVHREALEKQIRLISTLAYEKNDHLALNLRYISLPNPRGNLKDLEIQIFGAATADDRSDSRRLADSFRQDLANLMRITLRDAYLFQLEELEEGELVRATAPFHPNHVVELRRKVEFGTQPYIDQSSSPNIYHLEGNSSIARILDTLQSSPFACMVSIHLHPVTLTEAEKTFFQAYSRAANYGPKVGEGAMFYLGTERHPALHMSDAVTMRRMLGDIERLDPNLMVRLFVASDEPIPGLLLNTIGNELWGNESYDIFNFAHNKEGRDAVTDTLHRAWVSSIPAYVAAPEGLDRVPFLFDPYEASRMFRLPLDGHSGAVGTLFSVLRAPAAALPDDGIEIGIGFHSGAQKPIVVRLSDEERMKHTYIVGKTGTGKSTLLSRMIEQDIRRGRGVCVIDPHGDLVDSVLAKVPDDRISDVILFDPASTDQPFGLNLLEFDPNIPHHKDFVVQETIAIMRKMFFYEYIGPVFEHSLRHLVLTILDDSMKGEGTLVEVPRLLYDEKFRGAVIPQLRDDLASDYWKQYSELDKSTKSESIMYIVSKFDTFTTDRIMRNIIGQARSTINIPDIMEKKRILLVKLPSAVIGELNATLLGMIIISKLRWAGMSRAALPPGERKEYYLYVDEFQNFAASGFETILAEARKYGLGLILSHQHIGQLSAFNIATGRTEDRVAQAVFGNVGTIIAFRLGVTDAEYLAKEMGEPVDPEDYENLKNYHAIVKTLINGEVYPPFTIETVLSTTTDRPDIAENIRQKSLEDYGKPKAEVELEIQERTRRIIKDGDPT
jgi:predicted amidohydrolase